MPNQAIRGLKVVADEQRQGMPPRDFPAREQGKRKTPDPIRENTAIKEAELLSKLPAQGFLGSDGSAVAPGYFFNPSALMTATDVWNALDPELRAMIRREADALDLGKVK